MGVRFKGGSLHDGFGGFDGFGGSGVHLTLLLLVLQNTGQEATVTGLAVMTVSVMTATPLKLNPPFSVILIPCHAKPALTKPPFPIFRFLFFRFSRADHLGCILLFSCVL